MPPAEPKAKTQKAPGVTPEEWRVREAAAWAIIPERLHPAVETLIANRAAENKGGKIALSVRISAIEELAGTVDDFGTVPFETGLSKANRKPAGAAYVRAVAKKEAHVAATLFAPGDNGPLIIVKAHPVLERILEPWPSLADDPKKYGDLCERFVVEAKDPNVVKRMGWPLEQPLDRTIERLIEWAIEMNPRPTANEPAWRILQAITRDRDRHVAAVAREEAEYNAAQDC